MFLTSLNLQNFRSFKKKTFDFSSNTTLIIGPNASGKTNLLEAVVLLATGKSFKAGREAEMINEESDIGRVSGKIQNEEDVNLEVVLTRGEINGEKAPKKRSLVNGIAKRLFNFSGNLRTVLFEPEDIGLITGSPSRRRNYLDFVLSQVDREYYRCLLSYEKGLRRRNKILLQIREGEAARSQLEFWNRLLIKNGQILTAKRGEFIEFINSRLNNEAMKQWGNVELDYERSLISEARLEQYKEAEVAATATLIGPHRDDFKVLTTDHRPACPAGRLQTTARDLSVYGSRGEQRMAILLIKLAELEFVSLKTRQRPLLLLDDIFSELDKEHRSQILKIIPKQQTVFTTTDADLVDKELRAKIEIIKIKKEE